jgi:hypothetical protein
MFIELLSPICKPKHTGQPLNNSLTTCGKAETFAKKVILSLYEDGLLTWQEAQAIIDDLGVGHA